MNAMAWWMRIVGVLYLFMCAAAAVLRLPIAEEGPEGTLARAAAGDPLARFVVDSWVTLGLEFGAVGATLLVASRAPARTRAIIWLVMAMELAGIVADLYKLARGYAAHTPAPLVWLVIHALVIVTGLRVLSRSRPNERATLAGVST